MAVSYLLYQHYCYEEHYEEHYTNPTYSQGNMYFTWMSRKYFWNCAKYPIKTNNDTVIDKTFDNDDWYVDNKSWYFTENFFMPLIVLICFPDYFQIQWSSWF